MSELKVLISDSFAFASDHIAIAIVNQHNHEERSIMRIDRDGFSHFESVEPATGTKPTFTLPNDVARAVLDALLRHYQGASDMHTVRGDLLHERGRVDRMITAVIGLADKGLDCALENR